MKLNIILLSFLTIGCSKAWVISSNSYGGIIGYKNLDDSINEKIKTAAKKICGHRGWRTISDDLKSRNYTYTYNRTQTSNIVVNNGYRTGTISVQTNTPTQATGTTYWRELTIACS